jgi:6-phosphogluconate dehydrogenase
MEIGMVGLGKMGANMVRRLLLGGHRVVVYDIKEESIQAAERTGAAGVRTLNGIAQQLAAHRSVWVMLPAGQITEDIIQALSDLLSPGDTIIDGGNSNYKDSIRRSEQLAAKELNFIDVGTSGGVWGLKEGYSMMIGGDPDVVERHHPIFETLAPSHVSGWGYVVPSGSGHFVKMIHNGVEYGLMQAYAEGFSIMKAKGEFDLDLHRVADIWRYGSVVRSWLLDLTANALAEDQELSGIKAWVQDSGEGRWTVFEAIDLDVPAPVITASLQRRLRSRQEQPYADKLLAAMRNQFGGHTMKIEEE